LVGHNRLGLSQFAPSNLPDVVYNADMMTDSTVPGGDFWVASRTLQLCDSAGVLLYSET